jgi:hypothetical protein
MVITMLEAEVPAAMHGTLVDSYARHTRTVPESIVQSYLAQSRTDAKLWRIITVWRTAEDLAQMRASGETPTGIQIFREAGASSTLSVFDVKQTTGAV